MSNDDKKLPATSHWTPEVFRGEPPRATKEASPMPGEAVPPAPEYDGTPRPSVPWESIRDAADSSGATPLDPKVKRIIYCADALSKRLETWHSGAGPEYHCDEHASLADALQDYAAVRS